MLRSVKTIEGFHLEATDAEIGHVSDVLFEDDSWAVRYVEVETGGWIPGRRVLLAPQSLGPLEWDRKRLDVRLTKAQVEAAPNSLTDLPVSRQEEMALHEHYGWELYWPDVAGEPFGGPPLLAAEPPASAEAASAPEAGDPHLRSAREVVGYVVVATDGDAGHLADLLIDEDTWTIAAMLVRLGHLFGRHTHLCSLDWVRSIDWAEGALHLGVPAARVERAPRYEPGAADSRRHEAELRDDFRGLDADREG
jgi:hypothetical protein